LRAVHANHNSSLKVWLTLQRTASLHGTHVDTVLSDFQLPSISRASETLRESYFSYQKRRSNGNMKKKLLLGNWEAVSPIRNQWLV